MLTSHAAAAHMLNIQHLVSTVDAQQDAMTTTWSKSMSNAQRVSAANMLLCRRTLLN